MNYPYVFGLVKHTKEQCIIGPFDKVKNAYRKGHEVFGLTSNYIERYDVESFPTRSVYMIPVDIRGKIFRGLHQRIGDN